MSLRRKAKPKQAVRQPFCDDAGKVKHRTEKAALTSANRVSKISGTGLRVYKCPYCRDYHLTKQRLAQP